MALNVFENLYLYLSQKYGDKISNQYYIWFFIPFTLLFFAYAFYCTSRGYSFTGTIRYLLTGVSIACKA